MVRNARIKITVEDELKPYTEGRWAILTRSDFPLGFMYVERSHLTREKGGKYFADPSKAWRAFWAADDPAALRRALERGHRIELVGEERFSRLLAEHLGMLPESPNAAQLELPS